MYRNEEAWKTNRAKLSTRKCRIPRCQPLQSSMWLSIFRMSHLLGYLFDRRAQHNPRWSSWPLPCSRNASYVEVCHLFPPQPAFIIFTATRYFWKEGFREKGHVHWSHFLNHTLSEGLETAMKPFCYSGLSNSVSFLALNPSTTKHMWYFLYLFPEQRMFLLVSRKWWDILFPFLDS